MPKTAALFDVQQHFGAKADDSTDDSPRVTEAIDACVANGGGTVYFRTGTYRLASPIVVNADQVTFLGANRVGTKLRFDPDLPVNLDLGDNVTQRHYFTIERMTVTSNGTTGTIVRARKIDQFMFIGCQFSGGGRVMDFHEPVSCSLFGCGISTSSVDGLVMDNGDQCQIVGNYFEDQAGRPIHLKLTSGNKNYSIIGNNFSTGVKAMEIGTGPNTEHAIVGNTVENCIHGIGLRAGGVGLTRSTVVGNSLRGTAVAGGQGLGIGTENSDLLISGNQVTNYETNLFDGGAPSSVLVFGNPGIANRSFLTVVATASLPAASAAMDGTTLIEDAGAGNRNLIVYAGGERFRIDGGAAI